MYFRCKRKIVMNIDTEKLRVIEQLMQVDDLAVLKEIKELLKNYAVGYQSDGQHILPEDVIRRAQISDEAIEKGDVISLNDLEKEAENW